MSVKVESTFSRQAQRAIKAYGVAACIEAYTLNTKVGEGARTISQQYDLGPRTTQQADAAINAGREILAHYAAEAALINARTI
jgi:hypothetical protein